MAPAEAAIILGGRGSWRQYPAYAGQAAARVRGDSRYVLVSQNKTPIAAANLRIRRLPLIPMASALISHGPVLVRSPDQWESDLRFTLAALASELSARERMEIRIDPDPLWNIAGLDFERFALELGLSRSGDQYQTFLLDLHHSPDKLKKAMDPKWRSDLKKGMLQGLTITRSTESEDFARFQTLFDDLSTTKGFEVTQGPSFFASVANQAVDGERIVLHSISRDGELLSGHIGAFSGSTATYLLGATSARGRDLRASYVAQWAVIEFARSLGMRWYDLGGADEAANPEVFRFKKRMGGAFVKSAPAFMIRPSGVSGALLALARKAYSARGR